ncbi:MAG: serine/threonine-protein kinase, partial [Vicinamibacteria bacterium]
MELLREVSSLLHFHERAGSFLETPSTLARGLEKALVGNEPTFVKGEVVSGRFEIVRLLDRGGMGEVYEAWDRDLRERVALKTIRPELALDERSVEHFHEEVRLARRITHRNACRIHDIFRASDENKPEVLFLSMEYLEGESLAKRLRRGDRITWMEALPLLIQIAAALEAAWMEKVLHRDLKSENVMLVEDEGRSRAVVTDFGLASLADNVGALPAHDMGVLPARASSRAAWGTPAYMSPEQLRGEPLDHRSDLFSFGVIGYEMLTGEHPYPVRSGAPLLKRFRLEPRAPR